ncbi:MAG: PAS domain-containing sensor histidine kinase [Bacteroidales bacterium]
MGKTFNNLDNEFNKVIDEFQKYRSETEEHFLYLQTIVQHINVGIIVFDKHGKIHIFNNTSKKILKLNHLRNIKDLNQIEDDLSNQFVNLKDNEKNLFRLFQEKELSQISVHAAKFRMSNKEMTLISLQNIKNELDQKEVESWQKLIRVLTHEITNSITPISSLAGTIKDIIITEDENNKPCWQKLDQNDLEDVNMAMKAIETRSQGLLNFVTLYRNLTRIPKPNFRYFSLNNRLSILKQLFTKELNEKHIDLNIQIFPEEIKLTADPDLLQQVLINLIRNAIDALHGNQTEYAKITLRAYQNKNQTQIEIHDNGPGIKPDIMDKIFMPFFTSKKQGSGIGLSLSRQIIQMHNGDLNVESEQGLGTSFIVCI